MIRQPGEIEQIIEKTAKLTAEKIYAKMRSDNAKEQESLFSERLYNTRLLLDHYRLFKEHAENAVFELTRLDEAELSAIEIMDSMRQSIGPGRGEIAIESIVKSALRTEIVIRHIDEMLGIYEAYCYRSGKPENERRWDIINTMYIKPLQGNKTKTELYEELAQKHFISDRQVKYDINMALEQITALLFGIDGVRRLELKKKK